MYLEIKVNNNKTYLYKTYGARIGSSHKKVRIPLGELSFLKHSLKHITDDPIEYFKKQIDNENIKMKNDNIFNVNHLSFENEYINTHDIYSLHTYDDLPKNLGCIFLSKIYHSLNFDYVCKQIKREEKIKLPIDKVLQLLIFNRIINPSSKLTDFNSKNRFAENFNVSLDDIYRSLQYIYKHKDKFIACIRDNISSFVKLSKTNLHIDGSNTFVYTKNNDDNSILKIGYSKDHVKFPILQFLYFTDGNGIPLNFEVFDGNSPDVANYTTLLNHTKQIYGIKKSIIVADAGFVSNNNIVNTLLSSNGYIFKQSLLKVNKHIYSSFKSHIMPIVKETEKQDIKGFYKSIVLDTVREVVDINGKVVKVNIPQKFVFVYSKKCDDKLKYIRDNELRKVDDIIKNKKELNKVFDKLASGLIDVNFKNVDIDLNEDKLEKYEEISGFSLLITSEIELDDLKIIKAYKNQYIIEESFKILKSDLKVRPIFLKNEESIKSHMLVCFLSLLLVRILHIGLKREYTISKIIEAITNLSLQEMHMNSLKRICGYIGITHKISEYLGIEFDRRYIDGKEVRKKFGEVKKK